jgi:hypothetical protein
MLPSVSLKFNLGNIYKRFWIVDIRLDARISYDLKGYWDGLNVC